jgi:hypothetical protein
VLYVQFRLRILIFSHLLEKRKARMERKLKLKRQFDSEYDEGGEGKASFYEDLKKEVDQQANLNRAEWEGMEDAQRVLYEGFRPGMYVRIEIKVGLIIHLPLDIGFSQNC